MVARETDLTKRGGSNALANASNRHNATVTKATFAYVGSIAIKQHLIEGGGRRVGDRVLVVSNISGDRLEACVIAGERGLE